MVCSTPKSTAPLLGIRLLRLLRLLLSRAARLLLLLLLLLAWLRVLGLHLPLRLVLLLQIVPGCH